jgi:DNA-binding LacI/PurR family transcriptional regulator
VSIRDLARHLDISIGTVSRALNGKSDVNPDTRRRVLEAAERLGYVPNQSGRSLRQGTTNTIGFMIETGSDTTAHGDTFFMSVFDGVQAVFARHRLDLVALLCSSDESSYDYLRRIVARGFVDGLIISATQRVDPRIDYLAGRNIPFIALGRSLTDAGHPWFDLDFEGMARMGVERLVAHGHRRIAVTAPVNEANLGYVFVESYQAALKANGIAFDPDLVVRATPNETGGYDVARRLIAMKERPTAVLLVNEVMSVGLYRGLHEAGILPGRDMAVIGRDSPHARFLSPALTCFRLSLRELGIALAEALLSTMPAYRDVYPGSPRRKIWPMELVAGESDAFELKAAG